MSPPQNKNNIWNTWKASAVLSSVSLDFVYSISSKKAPIIGFKLLFVFT